jgi:signal transduction histidine kinase
MKRTALVPLVLALALWNVLPLRAAEFGTAAEARSMLERAVALLRVEAGAALAKFNKGDDGFRDRDLYVFCVNAADAKTTAHADSRIIGRDIREFKDPTGKPFGEEIYTTAQEGRITSVSYSFPRPGTTAPVAKESYVTRVGGQICGVGYYK